MRRALLIAMCLLGIPNIAFAKKGIPKTLICNNNELEIVVEHVLAKENFVDWRNQNKKAYQISFQHKGYKNPKVSYSLIEVETFDKHEYYSFVIEETPRYANETGPFDLDSAILIVDLEALSDESYAGSLRIIGGKAKNQNIHCTRTFY